MFVDRSVFCGKYMCMHMYMYITQDGSKTSECLFLAICNFSFQNPLIPEEHRESVVCHIVKVHQTVGDFSILFQQKLRRNNYVTPKNYLDFINSYLKLLEEKDKINLAQVYDIHKLPCLVV